MAKYVTYHDDDCPCIYVREVIEGDKATAQQWDYTKNDWVTTAWAWRILAQHDDKKTYIPEENVDSYIQASRKNDAELIAKLKPVEEVLDGATRKRDKNGRFIEPREWEEWKD